VGNQYHSKYVIRHATYILNYIPLDTQRKIVFSRIFWTT